MTLAVMQPYLFPYIGYFQLVRASNRFVFYDDVSYIRQGWINRNRVLVGGQPFVFTVPLDNASSFRLIRDIHVHPRLYPTWRTAFIKTFIQNYRKTPGFNDAMHLLETVLTPCGGQIGSMASESVRLVWNYLGLSHDWVDSSEIYDNRAMTGQHRLLDICGREGADTYVNPAGGRALYSHDAFAERSVKLSFLQPSLVTYPQGNHEFVPALSVLDILSRTSRNDVIAMLDAYQIV